MDGYFHALFERTRDGESNLVIFPSFRVRDETLNVFLPDLRRRSPPIKLFNKTAGRHLSCTLGVDITQTAAAAHHHREYIHINILLFSFSFFCLVEKRLEVFRLCLLSLSRALLLEIYCGGFIRCTRQVRQRDTESERER